MGRRNGKVSPGPRALLAWMANCPDALPLLPCLCRRPDMDCPTNFFVQHRVSFSTLVLKLNTGMVYRPAQRVSRIEIMLGTSGNRMQRHAAALGLAPCVRIKEDGAVQQGQRPPAVTDPTRSDSLPSVFPRYLPLSANRIFYTTDGGASLVTSSPYAAAGDGYNAIAMRNTSGGVTKGIAGDLRRGLHYCSGSGCW